jgi:hypothetical protein
LHWRVAAEALERGGDIVVAQLSRSLAGLAVASRGCHFEIMRGTVEQAGALRLVVEQHVCLSHVDAQSEE